MPSDYRILENIYNTIQYGIITTYNPNTECGTITSNMTGNNYMFLRKDVITTQIEIGQEVTFRAEKDDAGRDRAFFVKEFDKNYFYQQKSEEGPVKTLTGIDSNGNN